MKFLQRLSAFMAKWTPAVVALAAVFGVGLDYFGISPKDEAFDLIARAKEIFESDEVPRDTKEALYREMMKLYLDLERDDD